MFFTSISQFFDTILRKLPSLKKRRIGYEKINDIEDIEAAPYSEKTILSPTTEEPNTIAQPKPPFQSRPPACRDLAQCLTTEKAREWIREIALETYFITREEKTALANRFCDTGPQLLAMSVEEMGVCFGHHCGFISMRRRKVHNWHSPDWNGGCKVPNCEICKYRYWKG